MLILVIHFVIGVASPPSDACFANLSVLTFTWREQKPNARMPRKKQTNKMTVTDDTLIRKKGHPTQIEDRQRQDQGETGHQ